MTGDLPRRRPGLAPRALVAAALLPCAAAVAAEPPADAQPPAVVDRQGDAPENPPAPFAEPPPPEAPPGAGLPPAAEPPAAPVPSAPVPAADGTFSVLVGGPPAAPPAAVSPPPVADPADALLARLVAEPGAQEPELVTGRPLTLIEALERPGDRSRRLWIAQAYWKASAALAVVRARGDAVERLGMVAPGGDARDRDAIDAATAAARAELSTAHAELAAARQELADLSRLPPGEPLPWPADRPLVAPYQTHFAVIFATRAATGRIRAIDRMLPWRQAAVGDRGQAAARARARAAAAEEDHARGRCPVEAVLAAHGALTDAECAWARDVRTYNTDVAEYVMAVADTAVPDEQFARMLIGTPLPWRPAPVAAPAAALGAPGGVVGAGGTLPVGGPVVLPAPPLLVSPPAASPRGF